MSKYDLITHDYLLSILDYNPETGIFVWLPRTPDMFKVGMKFTREHDCKAWNTRFANKITGYKKLNNYLCICIFGVEYRAHILAWFYMKKEWPIGDIDHIDGNRQNNVFSNLRLATRTQNNGNSKKPKDNTSGYKGVSAARNGKWRATIAYKRKQKYLGTFETPQEAHEAYCKAAKKLHGEFARFE